MKKLYIVMAIALCAVFTADAGKGKRRGGCRNGMCGMQQVAPRATTITVAAATSWIAPRVNQGAESAQKITLDIQESIMKLEAELKRLNEQLENMKKQGATEEMMLVLRKKIKAVEEELNKLQQMQNCVLR